MSQVHFYPRAQAAIEHDTRTPFDLYGLLGQTMSYISSYPVEYAEPKLIELLDASYLHGGGWHDFKGFTLHNFDSDHPTLRYPGDPSTEAVCYWQTGNTRIILFDHAWVAVAKSNEDFRVARMD